MPKEFLEYLLSFVDKVLFWAGIVLLIPEIFKKIPAWKKKAEHLPHKVFWGLSLVCLVLASFQVWHEEKLKAKEGAVFVRPAGMTPKRAGINNPDVFPVGEKASVNVRWTVLGQKPALNTMQLGQVYLADDDKIETQKALVKTFQIWWEEQIRTQYEGHEHSPIFPDSPTTEQAWRTYQGPIISDPDKQKIKFGEKVVYVIAAVRFDDSLGEHETHLCRWLETHPDGLYGTEAWHDCDLWIAPIDIEK